MAISTGERVFDVAVVGAGPAGLAAAVRAADLGATVALIDAGARAGGQFWRQPSGPVPLSADRTPSSRGRSAYEQLVHRLEADRTDRGTAYLPSSSVWALERTDLGFDLQVVERSGLSERAHTVSALRLVLATGAYDRQVPFRGWDLPGVMTAGGVQALLKGHGVLAGERVVVAGTGPFLLPVAAGLARAGARVVGVHEAGLLRSWAGHGLAVARNPSKVREGVGHAALLARHRVPVRTGSVLVGADGDDRLESVTVAHHSGGATEQIECDTLAVGWGFTPQLELPLALGCATRVDIDGSLVAEVDVDQRTSVPGVFAAGETCGIGGATLAQVEGAIAGAAAAGDVRASRPLRRRRAAQRRFAEAIHQAHPVPAGWTSRLAPDTVVCRCEEVTAADLQRSFGLGAEDARSAKLLARPGMGWCQGRVCGFALDCLTAHRGGSTPQGSRSLATRPIASPVKLGSIAPIRDDES